MKSLKKLIKKLDKKLKPCKEWIEAQKFYLANSLESLKNMSKSSLRISLMVGALLLSGLAGQKTHMVYLEHKISPNVVSIHNPKNTESGGTGFHMKAASGKVVIVTNDHICEAADEKGEVLVMEKKHSGRMIPRRVLERYPNNDLCIVEGFPGYDGLELGSEPELSDSVYSFGYPLLEELNISSGRIKGFNPIQIMVNIPQDKCVGPRLKKMKAQVWFFIIDACVQSYDSINTDVQTFPGNSGSPLVNWYGNVVGVIFASNQRTAWGQAVAYKDLVSLLKAY